ncbi:MAG: thioredoxin-disulfide reductase [Candidatus Levybacteria bacterium CG_4_10_14_0_2_um_filter_36_16]|nr:MAG: thioredoxin-disulfide reductase [Candidatus Levybacteria bacterium CG2_30_37_29]PIR79490.1 MAG: thioredoxin-disulfide reductase [Candidatus Levybacteria bacterium CG10_big_fil_rev_8_21_14_0_10_36_30]PIZ97014.1 MAG: thioredoxin-disulfide reductase [Candidatus Levybacteria bacterium CG_4_10_14_0_2_um_filter_36_16]PJA90524.1 MAG: thioredoxin-disulfide reductase [Candidatus Levybacteria bacterium CG_4_9_14_3_um_filter_36_7]
MDNNLYDVIIIGSGPSGLTAAIYTTRANLKTLVIGGRAWGGQLMLTTEVENFPGFAEGIKGPDLMNAMRKQAEHHGAQILEVNYTRLQTPERSDGGQESGNFDAKPFSIITDDDKTYKTKTVIVATGADTKWLDVKGEKEKIGRGISSCAPCDGVFYRGKNVIVVGGGDSAMEEALVMTKFANMVTLIHRRDSFRASEIMQKRVKENPKIKIIYNTEVVEVLGDVKVTGVKIKNNKTNEISEMPIDGIFVAVGHMPNSAIFEGIDKDEKGFIKVYDHTKTNIEGVFVAGDVHDATYKQAVTAAGFGCMAALEVEKYLMDQG